MVIAPPPLQLPLIYLVNMNNSAISTRYDKGRTYGVDGIDVCLLKIENRFAQYKGLIDPGYVTDATDMTGGMDAMRQAVDQVLETGKPTYVISRFPFRPGGHASDANSSPVPVLLDQFKKTRDIYFSQFAAAAPRGTTGPQLADMMEEFNEKVVHSVQVAIHGTNTLTKDCAREISQPGSTTILREETGDVIHVHRDYYLNKNQSEFAGMGSDIYGRAINQEMMLCEQQGREIR